MSRKSAKRQSPRKDVSSPPAKCFTSATTRVIILGAVFVGFSTVMSLLLVLEEIHSVALPGCGEEGACEQAANSIWGKLPLVGWPTSFLGLAYFAAALITWVINCGALPKTLRYIVRLGVLASLFFSAILLVKWMVCPYCIAAHLGNIAFWITVEYTKARPAKVKVALSHAGVSFAAVSLALGIWNARVEAQSLAKAEADLTDTTQKIIEASRQTETQPAVDRNSTGAVSPDAAVEVQQRKPFTGRYRLGPEEAPIRIVMITDYQCRDCRRIEQQVHEIVTSRNDVSLSIKHFPFNKACNPCVRKEGHRNACWAARAAQAAGILWGDEGFFKMHSWLFQRRGVFQTTKELEDGIRSLGYDAEGFVKVMMSEETVRPIEEDCHEARALGLFFTPMIFINGVELKGWHAPQAVSRAIEQIAATNPPARSAAFDRPALAVDKYVSDWRDEQVRQLPPDGSSWSIGPEDAAVDVVLWGDYQENGTAEADGIIRSFIVEGHPLRYTFRHYPFDGGCNPHIPFPRHPLACWASQAAEAAGRLGGNESYWQMHAWLMEHQEDPLQAAATQLGLDTDTLRKALYTMTEELRQKAATEKGFAVDAALDAMKGAADEGLRQAAGEMGLDHEALLAMMEDPAVLAAIGEDIGAGKKLPQLRYGTRPGLHGIPTIFVNQRYVPRWQLKGQNVLRLILETADE